MSYYNRNGQPYARRRCDDEGYYYTFCGVCRRNTEHEHQSCVECDNRFLDNKRIREARVAKASVG